MYELNPNTSQITDSPRTAILFISNEFITLRYRRLTLLCQLQFFWNGLNSTP
jgi:hypothetical protein